MLFSHMLAKNEINLHVWAVGLVSVYGMGAIVAHVSLGPGGEYWALAAAVVDVLIGIEAGTRERRRDAQLIKNSKKDTVQYFEDLKKRQEAERLASRNNRLRDYEYWFQDVIKEYGLTKKGASDRTVPVELCGVPVATKDAGILIFIEDEQIILLDPEKVGSPDAIKLSENTVTNIVDARALISTLGEPRFRYVHDKSAEKGGRLLSGDTKEKDQIWVFNLKDISTKNLEYLENLKVLTEDFKDSETPSGGRIASAQKAMDAEQVDNIYFFFPAVLIYIDRHPDGVCEIISISYCDSTILENISLLKGEENYA